MFESTPRHSLLAEKGSATPSPDHRLAPVRPTRHMPSRQEDATHGDGLGGLIKRRTPDSRPCRSSRLSTVASAGAVEEDSPRGGDLSELIDRGPRRETEDPTRDQAPVPVRLPAHVSPALRTIVSAKPIRKTSDSSPRPHDVPAKISTDPSPVGEIPTPNHIARAGGGRVRKTPARRQLTVRIHPALFDKLDRLARRTRRSYQETLARAVERYLDGYGD